MDYRRSYIRDLFSLSPGTQASDGVAGSSCQICGMVFVGDPAGWLSQVGHASPPPAPEPPLLPPGVAVQLPGAPACATSSLHAPLKATRTTVSAAWSSRPGCCKLMKKPAA